MDETSEDVLAAMELLGEERRAMVTLSFNPLNGDRGWIASLGRSRVIGFGPTPAEALADLQAKSQQEGERALDLAS